MVLPFAAALRTRRTLMLDLYTCGSLARDRAEGMFYRGCPYSMCKQHKAKADVTRLHTRDTDNHVLRVHRAASHTTAENLTCTEASRISLVATLAVTRRAERALASSRPSTVASAATLLLMLLGRSRSVAGLR